MRTQVYSSIWSLNLIQYICLLNQQNSTFQLFGIHNQNKAKLILRKTNSIHLLVTKQIRTQIVHKLQPRPLCLSIF
uniref:Uncharacterized protein n=1 Tax=Populus trichocarpa TaxID=3694 RepID=A0A2K2BX60_POPTR